MGLTPYFRAQSSASESGSGVVGLHPDPPVAVVFVFRKEIEHPSGVGLDVDRDVDVVLRVEDLEGHVLFHVRQDLLGPPGEGIKIVFGGVPAQVGLGDDGVDEIRISSTRAAPPAE